MYASVRQYRVAPGQIDEAAHLADTEFADELAAEPGFVAYELASTEDGTVCAMAIFEDRDGAERSDRLAAEFVRKHLSGIEIERISGMVAEVMVSRARERVLEAAHH